MIPPGSSLPTPLAPWWAPTIIVYLTTFFLTEEWERRIHGVRSHRDGDTRVTQLRRSHDDDEALLVLNCVELTDNKCDITMSCVVPLGLPGSVL
jgi:hypothetical protein